MFATQGLLLDKTLDVPAHKPTSEQLEQTPLAPLPSADAMTQRRNEADSQLPPGELLVFQPVITDIESLRAAQQSTALHQLLVTAIVTSKRAVASQTPPPTEVASIKDDTLGLTLHDCSVDSGIGFESRHNNNTNGNCIVNNEVRKRIQQFGILLAVLKRDNERYRRLRKRLSKLVQRKSNSEFENSTAPDDSEQSNCCHICNSVINTQDVKSSVQCDSCQHHICTSDQCAVWQPKTSQWQCISCYSAYSSKEEASMLAQTTSWVAEQMSINQQQYVYPLRARSEIYIPIRESNSRSMHIQSISEVGLASSGTSAGIPPEQKLKIRKYVEEVVAQLLGTSLDDTCVCQLSKGENYLPAVISARQQQKPAATRNEANEPVEEFLGVSQTRLRALIENIIAETLQGMPLLGNDGGRCSTNSVSEIEFETLTVNRPAPLNDDCAGDTAVRRHRTEHHFQPQIYQDLLATAVINKIAGTRELKPSRLSESKPNLAPASWTAGTMEPPSRDSIGSSSIEPRSDCSSTDNEDRQAVITASQRFDRLPHGLSTGRESALSDYIAKHKVPLPVLYRVATESEEDDYMSAASSTLGNDGRTWECNWLFKRKRPSMKVSGTSGAGSIGVLVPVPKEDVRTQIGDQLADEVSDLSEAGSESEYSSQEASHDSLQQLQSPLNERLLAQHLIGGQNTKLVLDELIEMTTLPTADESPYMKAEVLTPTDPFNINGMGVQVIEERQINGEETFGMLHDAEPFTAEWLASNNSCTSSAPTAHLLNNGHNTNTNTIVTNTNTLFDAGVITTSDEKAPTKRQPGEVAAEADENDISRRKFRPGSIAEREYMKWHNAVDMPNNPYAPEALKKRISGSGRDLFMDLPNISPSIEQTPLSLMAQAKTKDEEQQQQQHVSDYKRYYSRDYYINNGEDDGGSTSPRYGVMATSAKSENSNKRSRNSNDNLTAEESNSGSIIINEYAKEHPAKGQLPCQAQQQLEQHTYTYASPRKLVSTTNTTQGLYQALPAKVLEETVKCSSSISLKSVSNPSLQLLHKASSSDVSHTALLYDSLNQDNVKLHSNGDSKLQSSSDSPKKEATRRRPTELQFNGLPRTITTYQTSPIKPVRGTIPAAFRFLQPKRKLIDLNQFLPHEKEDPVSSTLPLLPTPLHEHEIVQHYKQEVTITPMEKSIIEKEIVQALPSVKALALAFLQQERNSASRDEELHRWRKLPTTLLPQITKASSSSGIIMKEVSPLVETLTEAQTES